MRLTSLRIACLTAALLTGSCTAQLAPAYDQSITTGLATANTDMQTLFATVGTSTDTASFATARAAAYNKVIGELTALEMQARARPLPPDDVLTRVNTALTQNSVTTLDPGFTAYPSARAMHGAGDTVTHMRDADQAAGLRGAEIPAFEGQANIYMAQAITYENFLKR